MEGLAPLPAPKKAFGDDEADSLPNDLAEALVPATAPKIDAVVVVTATGEPNGAADVVMEATSRNIEAVVVVGAEAAPNGVLAVKNGKLEAVGAGTAVDVVPAGKGSQRA